MQVAKLSARLSVSKPSAQDALLMTSLVHCADIGAPFRKRGASGT